MAVKEAKVIQARPNIICFNEYRIGPETGAVEWRAGESRTASWSACNLNSEGHRKNSKYIRELFD